MPIIRINDLESEQVACYSQLTDIQLRNRLHPDEGIFIAESPKVIRTAIAAGHKPLSLLCEERHINGDAADIIDQFPDMPVYTASRQLLASLTGYTLTRGVLCAFHRPPHPAPDTICNGATRVAVIDSVTDTTNIGAIFRSAAALNIDAVLLTSTSCDPLNRRSIRVSMGTVFQVPWAWINNPIDDLHSLGFTTIAMALSDDSVAIDDASILTHQRLAIILGTEGDGLEKSVIDNADIVARIPMGHGVDSLNVAAASAVAFWQLRKR